MDTIYGYDNRDLRHEGICAALEALNRWSECKKSQKTDPITWAKIGIWNRFRELGKQGYNRPIYCDQLSDEMFTSQVDKLLNEYMYGSSTKEENQEMLDFLCEIAPQHSSVINAVFGMGMMPVTAASMLGKKIQRVSQIIKEVREKAEGALKDGPDLDKLAAKF